MSKVYIGAVFESNSGGNFQVIAKTNVPRYWMVRFTSGYECVAKETNIPYGKVKDYNQRSVYGVGILGASIKKPKGSFERQVYDLWANMLKRVYGQYNDHWKADYSNVQVCSTWHMYLVFREDIKELQGYEAWVKDSTMCLDKDLKDRSARLYSKHTCQFVTNQQNLSEASLNRWYGQ